MAKETLTRNQFEKIVAQEEKILRLLKEERKMVEKRFPLLYALMATFGLVCTIAGFNKFIEQIEWLNSNPLYLVGFGLFILVLSGAAYRKLG